MTEKDEVVQAEAAPVEETAPRVGDQVEYLLDAEGGEPIVRPAFVVRVWSPETVNLVVLLDGMNDQGSGTPAVVYPEAEQCTAWRTSVQRGEGTNNWRPRYEQLEAVLEG